MGKCGNNSNQVLGIRNAELMYTSAASQGGFFFYARVGMDVGLMEVVLGCILQQLLLVQTHQH
jgi:hypothetical protein